MCQHAFLVNEFVEQAISEVSSCGVQTPFLNWCLGILVGG